jgi:hypothetical protein
MRRKPHACRIPCGDGVSSDRAQRDCYGCAAATQANAAPASKPPPDVIDRYLAAVQLNATPACSAAPEVIDRHLTGNQ